MSSLAELKVVRLYRAYNTAIQMCMDRGYTVRHPSAVAQAIHDPNLYDDEDGLGYDWFLSHFVVQSSSSADGGGGKNAGANAKIKANEEEMHVNGEENVSAEKQWVPMYSAMRLVCSPTAAKVYEDTEGQEDPNDNNKNNNEKGRPLLVFFSGSPSLSMNEVQEYCEKGLQKNAHCMIIITGGKISPAVRRATRELSGRLRTGTTEEVMSIQLFEEDALAYNIARHETVPPHVVLSPEETRTFLQSRHLTLAQLPRILDDDPMVAYLGLTRGSVVRILRDSKESGPYDMYRQVI
ncbi:DNA-directed RNA polymerase II [Trypanosoma theileri]|uniref:DNA-directed RNA polymerase II n=1 Tax=Trypanosoma theileri TaxID=67003 RepID=A0A1X0P763_9TRYP|nr:DNA-directed RNA polymerase II [Trypanosoma theileri]ORC92671.1 DNA-directed RNA polymerase II [Trypanosoma theileri]